MRGILMCITTSLGQACRSTLSTEKGSIMKCAFARRSGRKLSAAVEVQSLERRQLFAAFASLSSTGTLSAVGDAKANQISFDQVGSSIVVARDGEQLTFDASL